MRRVTLEGEGRRLLFVHGPVDRPFRLRAARRLGLRAQLLDLFAVFDRERHRDVEQGAHGSVAVGKRFQHMRFRHETDDVMQGGKTGRETRHFEEFGDAVVRAILDGIHIRAGGPAGAFHGRKDVRQHGVLQEGAQAIAQLIRLRVDQGHRVRVVGAVRRMCVDHHVRVPAGQQAVEHLRVQAVALDEIAVQVQVAAIAAETELLRAILVHARGVGAVQAAIDVVDRNEQQHGAAQRRQACRIRAEVAHDGHAGVDAFRFARVDAVVVEENGAPCALDLLAVEHAVRADDASVDGHARVGQADLFEMQHVRIACGEILVEGDAFQPGRGLVVVTEFVGRAQVWWHSGLSLGGGRRAG